VHLAQWKALATTIAVHWAIDRLREAKVRSKCDAGLCDDADAYLRPTLHWEHRDPVDTKRYLAVLKDLFDSGQMPEHGEEILQGEADEAPHEEIAAELGVPTTVVHNRLFRMRAKFRARLAMLGMLILLLILFALLSPVSKVAAPAPAPVHSGSENRPLPSEEIEALPLN
jgi:DNA-directed RNA polymerase specialized sigma24 family protein